MEELKTNQRINLLGLDNTTFSGLIQKWGYKSFRASQVQRWIHKHGISSFDRMTDLSNDFREFLKEQALVEAIQVYEVKFSIDGTIKWLFDIGNNNLIETVFIPEINRGTLCISSQAGCAVNCKFCSTGFQGFNRNLKTREIISQVWLVKKFLEESEDRLQSIQMADSENVTKFTYKISNVVMMGMGEPLLNYKELLPAIKMLLDDNFYGFSKKKVTVSTSGVVPMIDRLAKDCPVSLAVSLHASNDDLRDELVPLNKKYPLKSLLQACENYSDQAPRKFITFEYCMLDSINDQISNAKELVHLIKRFNCKLNLIPFNPFPNSGLRCSSMRQIKDFCQQTNNAGIFTTIRKTRGSDIDAACGQLSGKIENKIKVFKILSD